MYRETEWLFSTQQGRRKLLASAKHNRLAIVSMHRGHMYKSWDDVKDELSGSVRNFAPSGLKNQQVRIIFPKPKNHEQRVILISII